MNKEDLDYIINIIKTAKNTYKDYDRTHFEFEFKIGKIFRKKAIRLEFIGLKAKYPLRIVSKPYFRKPNIEYEIEIEQDSEEASLIEKAIEKRGLFKEKKITFNNFEQYLNKIKNG